MGNAVGEQFCQVCGDNANRQTSRNAELQTYLQHNDPLRSTKSPIPRYNKKYKPKKHQQHDINSKIPKTPQKPLEVTPDPPLLNKHESEEIESLYNWSMGVNRALSLSHDQTSNHQKYNTNYTQGREDEEDEEEENKTQYQQQDKILQTIEEGTQIDTARSTPTVAESDTTNSSHTATLSYAAAHGKKPSNFADLFYDYLELLIFGYLRKNLLSKWQTIESITSLNNVVDCIRSYNKMNLKDINNQNIKCIIRFKPAIATEIDVLLQEEESITPNHSDYEEYEEQKQKKKNGIEINGNGVMIEHQDEIKRSHKTYSRKFDCILDGDTSQQATYYTCAAPVVDGLLDGFNGTIFAYGADDCGKSYTMYGNESQFGIVQRCIIDLYCHLERRLNNEEIDGFRLRYSGVRIHGKKMMDLFDDNDELLPDKYLKRKLSIKPGFGGFDDKTEILSTYVDGVSLFDVEELEKSLQHINTFLVDNDDPEDTYKDFIFMIHIIQIIDNDGFGEWYTSQLKLVKCKAGKIIPTMKDYDMYDLLESSDYTTRRMYKEVPFNHLLSDSFNNNRNTVMIGCCSKELDLIKHTIGTMKFGANVMTVKNQMDNNKNIKKWWELYIQPHLNIIQPLRLMVDPSLTFREIKYEIENRSGLDFNEMILKHSFNGETLDDNIKLLDSNVGIKGTIYLCVRSAGLNIFVSDIDAMSPGSFISKDSIASSTNNSKRNVFKY